ncbi:MAG: flagellin [Ignavibacteriales bacterium]|nr:flagellin [Ignavibacteriales bacterium]
MAFSVNTNLDSLLAFNALLKVNNTTQKAQLRLATLKKINTVADDTSGFNVGKRLEAQTMKQKAELNNVSSAKNYMATAEMALQQVNDKLNQISAKYVDSQDALKDKSSIAKDINTLAGEIDSILKNTNINGRNLLAQADGTALASSATFGVGGNDFTADFASASYLNADAIKTVLHGGSVADPGVASYVGSNYLTNGQDTADIAINSTVEITYADGSYDSLIFSAPAEPNRSNAVISDAFASFVATNTDVDIPFTYVSGASPTTEYRTVSSPKNITSFVTESGYDITTLIGITRELSGGSSSGGLMDTDTDTVLSAASDISSISNNVRSALGKIGNLSQTLASRSEFLTSSITNNTATIASIFDADVVAEQLNATKGGIAGQIGTAMFSQMNSAPQQLLSLFR